MSATEDSVEQPRDRTTWARARPRARALVVALVVVVTLGAGWLADSLTVVPQAPTTGPMTRQIGFSTVSVTASPTPLRANQAESLLMRVTDASGQAVVGARVVCALSMPDMAMDLPSIAATQTGQTGVYACATPPLAAGVWALDVTLTLPTGEGGHATFRFSVA